MVIYFLYKITNLVNGKCYIGQSIEPKKRWRYHWYMPKNVIGKALRKYGKEAFSFEVIAAANSQEGANDLEEELIIQYKAKIPNGYNILAKGSRKPDTGAKVSAHHLAKGVGGVPPQTEAAKACRFQSGHQVSAEWQEKMKPTQFKSKLLPWEKQCISEWPLKFTYYNNAQMARVLHQLVPIVTFDFLRRRVREVRREAA